MPTFPSTPNEGVCDDVVVTTSLVVQLPQRPKLRVLGSSAKPEQKIVEPVKGLPPADELEDGDIRALLGKDFKVGAQSNIKKVAGTIAHTCRDFAAPEDIVCRLVAGGSAAMNQAIKSIAIARQYLLKDAQEIWIQPFFEAFGAVHLEIRSKSATGKDTKDDAGSSQMRAAMASDPYRLAGAIAEQMRNNGPGAGVAVLAQGKGAVSQAVRSIIYARGYLRAENVDLQFQPSFMHVASNQGTTETTRPKTAQETRSVIRFQISQFPFTPNE